MAVGALVVLVGLAGCGSGSPSATPTSAARSRATQATTQATPPSQSTPPSPTGTAMSGVPGIVGGATTPATPATPATPSTGSAGQSAGSAGQSADAASSTAAIEKAYEIFFAPSTGNASMDHLQNGEQFRAVLNQQGQSEGSLAAGASAKVSKVTLISPDVAKVVFTIDVDGKPMLQNQPGYAVKQDGIWKVSDFTFCGLLHLEMGSKVPSACHSAVATQAPS